MLGRYASGAKRIQELLERVPAGAYHFRPSQAGAWTIAEHLNHLLDAEANAFVRYRKAVAEPGGMISPFDEEAWGERLDYESGDFAVALEAFGLLRGIAAAHLGKILEEDWAPYFYLHPEAGRVGLESWLKTYTDHVTTHIDYIERNLRLYDKR